MDIFRCSLRQAQGTLSTTRGVPESPFPEFIEGRAWRQGEDTPSKGSVSFINSYKPQRKYL
ncbi:hypothetical protein FACS1894164_17870 [Spirochaetia bacterium]|nr:hypothetical protein FACS1894164_17870 [Spirochaetia bacterium]